MNRRRLLYNGGMQYQESQNIELFRVNIQMAGVSEYQSGNLMQLKNSFYSIQCIFALYG